MQRWLVRGNRWWVVGKKNKNTESCPLSRSDASCQQSLSTGPHSVLTINWGRSGSEQRAACLWATLSHGSALCRCVCVCVCVFDSHMGPSWLGLTSSKMTCHRLSKSRRPFYIFKVLLCSLWVIVHKWKNANAILFFFFFFTANTYFFDLLNNIVASLCVQLQCNSV